MSWKPEIINALQCESDLPLKQIAEALGWDWDDEEIQRDLRELVEAGVVKQKEDSVDHDWFYRLSDSWLQRFRDHVLGDGQDPRDAQEIARDQSYRDWRGLRAMSSLFIVRLCAWLAGQDPSDYSESTREMLNAVLWESKRRGWPEGWWEDPSIVLEAK